MIARIYWNVESWITMKLYSGVKHWRLMHILLMLVIQKAIANIYLIWIIKEDIRKNLSPVLAEVRHTKL